MDKAEHLARIELHQKTRGRIAHVEGHGFRAVHQGKRICAPGRSCKAVSPARPVSRYRPCTAACTLVGIGGDHDEVVVLHVLQSADDEILVMLENVWNLLVDPPHDLPGCIGLVRTDGGRHAASESPPWSSSCMPIAGIHRAAAKYVLVGNVEGLFAAVPHLGDHGALK